MTDTVKNYNDNNKTQTREKYEIDEILAHMQMLDEEGVSLKQLAEMTAASPDVPTRSVHTLRYKYKEGVLTNKATGEKYTRSMRRFASNEELFAFFKIPYVGPEDVATRIAEYKAALKTGAVETA